ncbi:MAG: glycosyltransferase, partial [Terriglobales bacterium]
MIKPEIDVVIVAKNESLRLGSALAALSDQDYPHELLHVYVVDNDSSDSTADLARSHGATVIRHSGTVAAARNAGIRSGHGQIVSFIDAHCIVDRGWVREIVAAFKSDDIGGCMGPIIQRCDHSLVQQLMRDSIFADSKSLLMHTLEAVTAPYPWMPTGNCAYRREALSSAGLFNEALTYCEDTDMSWRVVGSGYLMAYSPQAKVIHHESALVIRYLLKQFNYGRGAADLANLYGFNGARKGARGGSAGRHLLSFCHLLGYRFGQLMRR